MKKKTYSEKLRDPRWQKKRLQVLDRDLWACQMCSDTESTLHVHHRYYTKGAEPWEYDDAALQTLCEECHTEERELRPEAERELLDAMRRHFDSADTAELARCVRILLAVNPQDRSSVVIAAVCYALEFPDMQAALVKMYWDRISGSPPPPGLEV